MPPPPPTLTDPSLIEAAEICYQNEAAYQAYNRARKTLHQHFHGVTEARLGRLRLRGWTESTTLYKVPKEVKAKYAESGSRYRFVVECGE